MTILNDFNSASNKTSFIDNLNEAGCVDFTRAYFAELGDVTLKEVSMRDHPYFFRAIFRGMAYSYAKFNSGSNPPVIGEDCDGFTKFRSRGMGAVDLSNFLGRPLPR